MGIFNHIGEKDKEDSAGIINFGILAAEYVRKEQMANYLHKGKNQMNILRSSLDMGNNNITNLKDPSGPRDVIPKRILLRRLQRFAKDYKLEELSAMGSENKAAIKAIQNKLKENRQACQVDLNLLRKELETMSESLKTEIDSNESKIMKKNLEEIYAKELSH